MFGPAQGIVNHAYLMVDLFFVLSGFVMMLTYGPRFTQTLRGDAILDFLLKRLFRVYPLFFAVTCAMIFLHFFVPGGSSLPTSGEIVANLLLLQAWDVADSICGPAWSISTELGAYLLFPALALLLAKRRWAALPVAIVAIALLIFISTRSNTVLQEIGFGNRSGPLDAFMGWTPFPLLRCVAGFTLGMLSFRVWRLRSVDAFLRRPMIGDALGIALLVLLGSGHADVLIVLLFAPFVLTLAHGTSRVALLAGSPVIHWLGLVSYSIYLVHEPLTLLSDPMGLALAAIGIPHVFTVTRMLLLLLVIGVACLTYYGIERPARDGLRNLLQRPVGRANTPAIAR